MFYLLYILRWSCSGIYKCRNCQTCCSVAVECRNFTAFALSKFGMSPPGSPRATAKMALMRLEEGLLLSIPVRERPETKCSKGCIITGIDEA